MEIENPREILELLWKEHKSTRFPEGFRVLQMEGKAFILVDADIAGCISTFLSRGTLDPWRLSILAQSALHLSRILPALSDEGQSYFWRLGRMAELVFEVIVAQGRED